MFKKINIKILFKEIGVIFKNFYPYFIGFYLLSALLSFFFRAWSNFFNWPAFHIVIILFTFLFVFLSNFKLKVKIPVLSRNSWIKIAVILAILIFSLLKGISNLDFLVLSYALISVFFIVNSRYSGGIALAFLISGLFLSIFKLDSVAENAAIFAFYFLVITVLTAIMELKNNDKKAIKKDQ